jgi:hypothetical protein
MLHQARLTLDNIRHLGLQRLVASFPFGSNERFLDAQLVLI